MYPFSDTIGLNKIVAYGGTIKNRLDRYHSHRACNIRQLPPPFGLPFCFQSMEAFPETANGRYGSSILYKLVTWTEFHLLRCSFTSFFVLFCFLSSFLSSFFFFPLSFSPLSSIKYIDSRYTIKSFINLFTL